MDANNIFTCTNTIFAMISNLSECNFVNYFHLKFNHSVPQSVFTKIKINLYVLFVSQISVQRVSCHIWLNLKIWNFISNGRLDSSLMMHCYHYWSGFWPQCNFISSAGTVSLMVTSALVRMQRRRSQISKDVISWLICFHIVAINTKLWRNTFFLWNWSNAEIIATNSVTQ